VQPGGLQLPGAPPTGTHEGGETQRLQECNIQQFYYGLLIIKMRI
jgi:hypothetical protein